MHRPPIALSADETIVGVTIVVEPVPGVNIPSPAVVATIIAEPVPGVVFPAMVAET
jgi:hypothetical protein